MESGIGISSHNTEGPVALYHKPSSHLVCGGVLKNFSKFSSEISSDEALKQVENVIKQVEDFEDLNPDLEVERILLGFAMDELIEKASYLAQQQDLEDLDFLNVAIEQIESENKKLEKSPATTDKIDAGIKVKWNAYEKIGEIYTCWYDKVVTKDPKLPEIMNVMTKWKEVEDQVKYWRDNILASYEGMKNIHEKTRALYSQILKVKRQIIDMMNRKADFLNRKYDSLQRSLLNLQRENDNLRRKLAKMSLCESTNSVICRIEMYYEEALLTPPYGFQNRNVGELLGEEILPVSEVGEAALANEGAASQVQNDSEIQLNEDIDVNCNEENSKDLSNEISKK